LELQSEQIEQIAVYLVIEQPFDSVFFVALEVVLDGCQTLRVEPPERTSFDEQGDSGLLLD
jgi:hypothetical protein